MKSNLYTRLTAWFSPLAVISFPAPRKPDPQFLALTGELRRARRDLTAAYGQFNQAASPEAVETCVYRIRAGEARCEYLWRAVKAWESRVLSSAQ